MYVENSKNSLSGIQHVFVVHVLAEPLFGFHGLNDVTYTDVIMKAPHWLPHRI